eukprot:jgi/Mesvir1/15614/Mv03221-RA.1
MPVHTKFRPLPYGHMTDDCARIGIRSRGKESEFGSTALHLERTRLHTVLGNLHIRGSSCFAGNRGFLLNASAMNPIKLAGDMTHLLSIILLLLNINATKSCAGISLKTQELYALVFVTRYQLDIFASDVFVTSKEIIFLVTACTIIWLMRRHRVVSRTYDKEQDTFRVVFLIVPAAVLACVLNNNVALGEVLWAFSIYLEAVAILPQLMLLQRTRNVDNLTGTYVFMLGAYRALYLLNWIYRFFTDAPYTKWHVWIAGIVQTLIYCDFFYYYVRR